MGVRFCLLFLLGTAVNGAIVLEQVEIESAAARTNSPGRGAKKAIDGNTATMYHSDHSGPEQWLRLELKVPTVVENVVIFNRFVSLEVNILGKLT